MPAEFFSKGSLIDGENILYTVQADLVKKLELISVASHSSIFIIFTALYGYLLSDINGLDQVEIQVQSLNGRDNLLSLGIDTAVIKDYSDLFFRTRKKLDEENGNKVYSLKRVLRKPLERKENEIVPLIINKQALNSRAGLESVFDLVLEINETGSTYNIEARFNSSRLNGKMVREFMDKYVKLIGLLVQNFKY